MHWMSSAASLPVELLVLLAGQLHTPFQSDKKHQDQHDGVVQRAVNSGMGFIVGDILAQRLTGEAFDAVRSLELGLYGTLLGMSRTMCLRVCTCLTACYPSSITIPGRQAKAHGLFPRLLPSIASANVITSQAHLCMLSILVCVTL